MYTTCVGSSYDKPSSSGDESDDSGIASGLFKRVNEKQRQSLKEKDFMNAEDCSKFVVSQIRDWSSEQVSNHYFHLLN